MSHTHTFIALKAARQVLAGLVLCAASVGAQAQESFIIRVPVLSAVHAPTTTEFDFGAVVVGTMPQRDFIFLNRSAKPTTMGAITASGNARVVTHDCQGTLEPSQTCTLTLGVTAATLGKSTGAVSISHSQAAAPDIFSLSVTGVAASESLQFDQTTVNFGKQLLRVPSEAQLMTLRNKGSEPAEIVKIGFATNTFHYQLIENNCEGTLAPGGACEVAVAFRPQSLGLVSASLAFWLEDGSKVPAVQLQGTGVKAIPSWSAETVNFIGVPAGQTSAPQTVTLTNSGQGDMGISDLTVLDNTGESAHFSIAATTCSTTLLPGASCDVSVVFNAPDTAIRSATLKLTATGTASTTSPSVQLFAQPALMQGLLSVDPASLSFGNVPVTGSKTLNLTLRSVGETAVSVSGYVLSGTNSADFRIVNESACVGSLAPGMQCVLQIEALPSAGGSRYGTLSLSHDASEPVSDVPLTVVGVLGSLEAAPATVTFVSTEVGQVATQSVVLTNKGQAPLQVNKQTLAGTAAAQFTATNNCVSALAVGESCTVTVTYKPTVVASHTATLTFTNTGSNPSVVVNLAGAGKAAPVAVAALSDFVCPTPAQAGVQATCTATLSNPGPVAFTYTGAGTSSSTQFTPTVTGCTGTVAPGATCTVNLRGTFTAGSFSTTYSLVTSAQTLTKPVTLTVEAPKVTLTAVSHGTVELNQFKDAVHTLSNTGNFPASLTLPATLASGSSTAYTIRANTCGATLAAGASCTVTTRCLPTTIGSQTGTLNVTSNSGTPVSGALSCVGAAPPATTAGITFNPNPADFGSLPVGAAAVDKVITLANTNPAGSAAVSLGTLSLTGTHAADFSVKSRGTCGTSLTAGSSCTFTLTGKASVAGIRSATLTLTTNLSGAAPALSLTALGVSPVFSVTPASTDFGTVAAGTAGSRTITVANVGTVAGSLVKTTPATSNSTLYTYGGTCSDGLALAPGASCTRVVSLSTAATALRGAQSGSLTFSFSGGAASQTATFTANLTAPAVAAGTVALTCPATSAPSTTINCTATVNSTGTANLSVTNWGLSRQQGTTVTPITAPTATCSTGSTISSIAPGKACSVPFSFSTSTLGSLSVIAAPTGNAALTSVNATVQVLGPSLSLTATPHPDTQVGSSTTVSHTLTNTGPSTITISGATSTVTALTVNRTACTSLASGQSCLLTTTCTPASTGALTSTIVVTGSPTVSTSAAVTCTAQGAKVTTSAEPDQTARVGGFTTSGNWVRLTNAGVGPVTVQGMYPAAGWTLYGNLSVASNCAVNRVLQPGQSCVVLERLTGTQGPGLTVTGNQRIRTTAGDSFWPSTPLKTEGLSFAPVAPFGVVQVGDVASGVYSVTNTSAWPLATPITFTSSNSLLTVASHTCPPALAAGASCQVTLRYAASLTNLAAVGMTLKATAAYPVVANNVVQPVATTAGVQGTLSITLAAQAAKVTLTPGSNVPVNPGTPAQLVHTVANEGVSPVTITGNPTLSANSQHAITGGTCTNGTVLGVGQSCIVITQFTPTSATQSAVTLTLPTSVGSKATSFTGKVIPQVDVVTTVSGPSSSPQNKANTYTLSVNNKATTPTQVVIDFGVTPQEGATGYLASLSGGVCGNWSYAANGSATASGPASTVTGFTCTMSANARQLTVKIPSYQTYSAQLSVFSGTSAGKIQVSASATTSEATDTLPSNNAAAVTTSISPMQYWSGGGMNFCGGGWGFDHLNRVQCNYLHVSKWRTAGKTDTSLTDSPAKASPYYLVPPLLWNEAGQSWQYDNWWMYPDINIGWGYWNEKPRTGKWSDNGTRHLGPFYADSNGTKYLFLELDGHNTPQGWTGNANIYFRTSAIVALNANGTLKYVARYGSTDTSRIPQLHRDIGHAFDPARGIAYVGGYGSGTSYSAANIYKVRLSDGAILDTMPISRYGAQFAYDRVSGDLYFINGTTQLGVGTPYPFNQLVRYSPSTGQTQTITLPRTFKIYGVMDRFLVHNGKIYFMHFNETTNVGSELLKIDVSTGTPTIELLGTNPEAGYGAYSWYMMFGGPGDPHIYVPRYQAKIALD